MKSGTLQECKRMPSKRPIEFSSFSDQNTSKGCIFKLFLDEKKNKLQPSAITRIQVQADATSRE